MSDSETVHFFDKESERWHCNYAVGGDMEDRPSRFLTALSGRVAPGGTILDYGCGTGEIAAAMAASGFKVSGVDVAPGMLQAARARLDGYAVSLSQIDPGEALPLQSAAFDACVASSVLEYVNDLDQTLDEFARVLRPGGWLLATVPDVRHSIRRREALMMAMGKVPLLGRLARARWPFATTYLRLSKNRFAPERWQHLLLDHGFEPTRVPAVDGPLLMLAAHKRKDIANQ
jgi:ubiquinone/menaquinone biosynthesis C-methylase UbiE